MRIPNSPTSPSFTMSWQPALLFHTSRPSTVFFKHHWYLSREASVRQDILAESHSTKSAGHPGEKRTFARVASAFYWPGMRVDVRKYVAACTVCQSM